MELTVKIKPEFVDDRGLITKILDDGKTNIKSVLLITSKAGSVRSNHYHKKDAHWIYMITGSMEYYEKPVGGGSKTKKVIVNAGDIIARALCLGNGGDRKIPELLPEVFDQLKLTTTLLEECMANTLAGVKKAGDFFDLIKG